MSDLVRSFSMFFVRVCLMIVSKASVDHLFCCC